jgi:hypothetical protein
MEIMSLIDSKEYLVGGRQDFLTYEAIHCLLNDVCSKDHAIES